MTKVKNKGPLLLLKGMAMGAADVVPGVSGGTVAFITGIYDELIDSLKSLSPEKLLVLKREGFARFWEAINGTFLVTLFGGILLSVFSMAKGISHLLETYPLLLWSFFFGLILVSAFLMKRRVEAWKPALFVWLILGTAFGVMVTELSPANLPGTPLFLFMGGAIAICAMVLPGISGSFMLLIMGLYAVVIDAVRSVDIVTLSYFAVGCGIGLLLFSRLISWLLHHFHDVMTAFLIGLMFGSLNKIWPWKQNVEVVVTESGKVKPLIQNNLLPWDFERLTGEPSMLSQSVAMMIGACAMVLLIDYIARKFGAE
ncbi:DUF368 domain-containing protein [Endozoicomonadaceae bacterium StTr2]